MLSFICIEIKLRGEGGGPLEIDFFVKGDRRNEWVWRGSKSIYPLSRFFRNRKIKFQISGG